MNTEKPFIVSNFESNEAPNIEELARTELSDVELSQVAGGCNDFTMKCTPSGCGDNKCDEDDAQQQQ